MLNWDCKVRNLPQQSANAEAFAEAYLHFIVFDSAIKLPSQTLKKKFFVKEKKFCFIKLFSQDTNYSCASIFIIHTFISYIFNSLL